MASDRLSDEDIARWAPSVTACALNGPTAHEVHALVVEVREARALIAEAGPAIDELLEARARIAELERELERARDMRRYYTGEIFDDE